MEASRRGAAHACRVVVSTPPARARRPRSPTCREKNATRQTACVAGDVMAWRS